MRTKMNILIAATRVLVIVTEREFRDGDKPITWPEEGPLSRQHIKTMMEKVISGEVEGEKAHRFLGWAQCATVAAGASTLHEMRTINADSHEHWRLKVGDEVTPVRDLHDPPGDHAPVRTLASPGDRLVVRDIDHRLSLSLSVSHHGRTDGRTFWCSMDEVIPYVAGEQK